MNVEGRKPGQTSSGSLSAGILHQTVFLPCHRERRQSHKHGDALQGKMFDITLNWLQINSVSSCLASTIAACAARVLPGNHADTFPNNSMDRIRL